MGIKQDANKMAKAKMITYKCIDEEYVKLDVTEWSLSSNNIRMGKTLPVSFPERKIVVLETQIDSAMKIIKDNGCVIVNIEDDFFMTDLTDQELKTEMDRIEKMIQPLEEFYYMEVIERAVGKRCLIGIHIRLEPGWFYVFVENPMEVVKNTDENTDALYSLRSKNVDFIINKGDTPCVDITIKG